MADQDRWNDERRGGPYGDRETAWHGRDRRPPNNPEREAERGYIAHDDGRGRGRGGYEDERSASERFGRRYGAGDYERRYAAPDDYPRYASQDRGPSSAASRGGERWPTYTPGPDSPDARDRSAGWPGERWEGAQWNRGDRDAYRGQSPSQSQWRGEAGPSGRYPQSREAYPAEAGRAAGQGEERPFWDRARDEVATWFGDRRAEARRQAEGEHRGRGPRGYRRSDERIHDDVNDRLTDDPYLDASGVEVRVQGGEVTLNGRVRTREDKRRAEDIAEGVTGVTHVQNNLRAESGLMTGNESWSPVPPTPPF